MNNYIATGRVANEPIFGKTQSGKSKLTFTFISGSRIKEGNEYLNFTVSAVIYGKPAETLYDTLSKGSPLTLSGDLGTRIYADENGEKRYYTFLQVDKYDYGESLEMALSRKNRNQRIEDDTQVYPPVGRDMDENDD
ncbi:single-stranded DNA-binding protein [Lactococcus lactis]|uniref:single-stranded DNA-binding protein n=1 Tax=Lactococcus TaxID=1357 RepID=UPI0025A02126|nr:single-stranded DNA-binding protein [Lactococcus lactis]MDM7659352.1 single-stranded DNA-binding protein [Lactococcus lactis]MDQ7172551.1 single-stranded DNA-binding protein [Lactococcus lactis]WMM05789.1 single-stranded DNA-binding protein [Lactococcus lactis]WMM20420.1 single-stranded DNA-binding protein [Lactococcus lactis]WMM21674.1 single-stranded DNA-binding protein [Lactococcus lactis]